MLEDGGQTYSQGLTATVLSVLNAEDGNDSVRTFGHTAEVVAARI